MFVLGAAACGDDDSAAPTSEPDPDATTTTASDDTTTTVSSTTEPASPDSSWERCENPEGFEISYPADWAVNDGSVTEPCSLFDPEAFTVPEATDERVAAISAFVDPVPFDEVSAPDGDEVERSETTVDGFRAVRTVEPAGELYGDDTETTRYAIDLATGDDDGGATMFVDVVDLEGVDYDSAVRIMDQMVRTVDITVR